MHLHKKSGTGIYLIIGSKMQSELQEIEMRNNLIKVKKRTGKRLQYLAGAICVLFVFVCYQNMAAAGKGPAVSQIGDYVQEKLALQSWKNCMPVMLENVEESKEEKNTGDTLVTEIGQMFPVYKYTEEQAEYETQVESELSYEVASAAEGVEETKLQEEQQALLEKENQKTEKDKDIETMPMLENVLQQTGSTPGDAVAKAVEIPREKLYDFDYLVHNFYQVDRTTTIDGTQLNPDLLLGEGMKIKGGSESPQILIYHTHSQEGYSDSEAGNTSATVVGVGEYLSSLLRDKYGFNVMHHTGEYDVEDRDNAYSYAGPALEQILAENPSIEVVIDLHRDGVAETTRLVSEVNGKQTAQVMFFNGLSRTTKNGDLTNLPNQYIADNLALSFQMKLAADEYYPGFTRSIYLKGYRYNMHYCPKTMLVEVGAQTNTLQEAMNAMEPLSDLLHKVLGQ